MPFNSLSHCTQKETELTKCLKTKRLSIATGFPVPWGKRETRYIWAMNGKTVGIVGTGPAALMAGTVLAEKGWMVSFFDHKKAPARKFLVAGHGGFNLTNGEALESFVQHYDHPALQAAVRRFSNQDFIAFLAKIGIPTYAGSSGKIFPLKHIKPIMVLDAWLHYLVQKQAQLLMEYELIGFSDRQLVMEQDGVKKEFRFDRIILALGGASWPVTGSDGRWTALLAKEKIPIVPFAASNSGFELEKQFLIPEQEGKWVKNICLYSGNTEKKGDFVLTKYGMEGATVYAMNRNFRRGEPVYADFKPGMAIPEIRLRLQKASHHSRGLRDLRLSEIVRVWLKRSLSKEAFLSADILAASIKHFMLPVTGLRPVKEVISTVGGIPMSAVSENFALKQLPHNYCIGEMLDWDAPTGGYLIQGCVSSGYCAAWDIIGKNGL